MTGPKPLKDEEQHEYKREVLEKSDPGRDDDAFPVDPRDPKRVIWQAA